MVTDFVDQINIGIKGRTEYYQFCLVLHFKQFLYSNGKSWCNQYVWKKNMHILQEMCYNIFHIYQINKQNI